MAIASPHGIVIPLEVDLANLLGHGDMQNSPLPTFFPKRPPHKYTQSRDGTVTSNQQTKHGQ